MPDTEKADRKVARWQILRMLLWGGDWAVSEGTIQLALEDGAHHLTQAALRKELRYLEGKGLIKIHTDDIRPIWAVTLTSAGTDVAEYNAVCPEGIGRPRRS